MTKEVKRRQFLFLICSIFAIALGLRYSELCAEGVRQGIELSVNKLIPSLFPFMVIAELIVSTNACELLSRALSKPFSKIFKISREGALPFLLGMLFGFPIGIKSAISLYECGKIDRSELIRLSLFTSIPSPAFFISAVGEGLFGSAIFGAVLYLIALFGSILIGFFCRSLFQKERGIYFLAHKQQNVTSSAGFVTAVSSSAFSLISVSAFVVFFSMISAVLKYFFELTSLNKILGACILGALEMTGGALTASTLGERGAPLAAAILGFSGISVLCQFISIEKEHKLPIMPYLLSKMLLAALEFLLSLVIINKFSDIINISEPCAPSFILYRESKLSIALFALFICACFIAVRERKRTFFRKTIYKS